MAKVLAGSSLPEQTCEFNFELNRVEFPEVSKTHMAFTNIADYHIDKVSDDQRQVTLTSKKGAKVIIACTKDDAKYLDSTMIMIKLQG
ncbi:MAG: hypothetical protein ACRDBX_07330 [Erysipelotrichaceae bacterium]